MADENLNRPYIGYRSAGRRPESQQDRRASADAPLALLRGLASGILGAPGDLESLVRMLPGLSERTILPTSADVESGLPLPQVSATPVGRAATGLGTLAGGFYNGPGAPIRAVTAIPAAIRHGAEEFVRASAIPSTRVVKPKGGNWIQQSLDEGLSSLKRPLGLSSTDDLRQYLETARTEFPDLVPQYEQQLRERLPKEAINKWVEGPLTKYIKTYMGTPEDPVRAAIDRRAAAAQATYRAAVDDAGKQLARAAQIRAEGPRPGMPPGIWEGAIDRAQYQGETALQAADDALLMSEKSQAHIPLEEFHTLGDPSYVPWSLRKAREEAGFPAAGMATHPAAMGWERGSDLLVKSIPAGDVALRHPWYVAANPWLAKLNPEDPVYIYDTVKADPMDAGLPDLINTLESAMNPRARLPGHLRLNPEDLAGYSMEKAVQRAAEINAWKAEQQAAKGAAKLAKLAESPTVRVHKEYPESVRGLRWVEIQKPTTELPEGWQLKEAPWGGDFEVLDNTGAQRAVGSSAEEAMSKIRGGEGTQLLEEQLKNEGRLMDNCVGGYCSKVESGKAKIYSLRDAKGNPHVTVEVGPGRDPSGTLHESELPTDVYENFKSRGLLDPNMRWRMDESLGRYVPEIGPFEPSIVQIKGKQNKAPGEQYLPYVQDFVKSQKWGKVEDLQNTGLVQFTPERQHIPGGIIGRVPRFEESGIEPGYYTEKELEGLITDWQKRSGNYLGFASGGLVTYNPAAIGGFARGGLVNDEPMGYNPDLVDSMVEQLRTELMHGQ